MSENINTASVPDYAAQRINRAMKEVIKHRNEKETAIEKLKAANKDKAAAEQKVITIEESCKSNLTATVNQFTAENERLNSTLTAAQQEKEILAHRVTEQGNKIITLTQMLDGLQEMVFNSDDTISAVLSAAGGYIPSCHQPNIEVLTKCLEIHNNQTSSSVAGEAGVDCTHFEAYLAGQTIDEPLLSCIADTF